MFLLTLTIGVYILSVWLYRKSKIRLLHPMLTSTAVIIIFLKIAGIEYETYASGTQLINFMLGVSVVALGYLLYEQLEHLKGRLATILTSVVVGSVVGIASVVLIARWMGADELVVRSLQPKQVTMPIALSVSATSGGIPPLTSMMVIIAGMLGGIVGPAVMDKLGINDRIARGLALGSASHAVGTARAIELGAVEGAISGLAIGLMGIVTAVLIPVIERFL
ncbi:LrgB family protein [Alistipes sp. OttesenSCG-928-L06]|nr:LrgB family protein [Alistipes sp. OttesenSCG-928-L06]